MGFTAAEYLGSKHERVGDGKTVKSGGEEQTAVKGTAEDEGAAAKERVAQPPGEGGSHGAIQEVRVHRGPTHHSRRVPQPKPEFLPLIPAYNYSTMKEFVTKDTPKPTKARRPSKTPTE